MGALEPEEHWLQAELASASCWAAVSNMDTLTCVIFVFGGRAASTTSSYWLHLSCLCLSAGGDIVGHIRLFYDEQAREEAKGLSLCFIRGEEDAVISNFKNIQSPDWGWELSLMDAFVPFYT